MGLQERYGGPRGGDPAIHLSPEFQGALRSHGLEGNETGSGVAGPDDVTMDRRRRRPAGGRAMVLDCSELRDAAGRSRPLDSICGLIRSSQAKEPPSLEVRPALHYPATVRLDGALIEEPAAVEGFVTRIRSGQANERVYVTSVDGFLFLVRPRDALTPRAPSAPDLPRGPARRLSISMPPLAFREPSSGTKSKFGRVFSSGGPSSSQQVSQDRPSAGVRLGDTVQAHEANRLRDMLKRSFAFIDMREISGVTALMPEDDGPDASTATDYGHGKDASRASHPGSKTRRPGFEIEFSGGRRVRFETTHPEVAQEWVERLPALIKYWKKRWEVDVKVRMTAQTDEVGGSLTDTEHARSRALSSI